MLKKAPSLITILALAGCLAGQASDVAGQSGNTAATAPAGKDPFGYSEAFDKSLKKVGQISPDQFAKRYATKGTYLGKLGWDVTKAKFFADYQQKFKLSSGEMKVFKKNGFVVTPRMGGASFSEIYYNIFSRNLPVFISSDSLLHAWHRSYDAVLEELEKTYLSKSLDEILSGMAGRIANARRSYGRGVLGQSIADADYFIAVARSLLAGKAVRTVLGKDKQVAKTLVAVKGQRLEQFTLFGKRRKMDFSQFKPRGHYEKSEQLKRYFKAMMWLGRIDMRVSGDGNEDYRRQLGSAIVLHDLLAGSGRMKQWAQFDRLIQTFVGRTDSMTFAQLGKLLDAGGIDSPTKVTSMQVLSSLQSKLRSGKLGMQHIRSHAVASSPLGSDKAGLPRSFTVLGQKFTVDSWATSKVVSDDIMWNKQKVQRRMPSGLDVAFSVLGNDQTVPFIVDRIKNSRGVRFRDGLFYQHNLAAVRQVIDAHPAKAWSENIYMHWLGVLRALSGPTIDKKYPQVMRTKAWASKTLNTQLASWAQLRHDTILYVKQSYTAGVTCYYPAGFVEPRVDFWKRLEAMASATSALLKNTPYPNRTFGGVSLTALQTKHIAFFANFAAKVKLLRQIAEKQIAQKELTKAEERILRDVVQIQHMSGSVLYNGWYPTMFYSGREDSGKWDALVADVHTNVPAPMLGDPGGVLHQGVGNVDFMMVAIDNGKDKMVYAGPTFSHYEFVLRGTKRRSDSEWKKQLKAGKAPARPVWTKSYLVE